MRKNKKTYLSVPLLNKINTTLTKTSQKFSLKKTTQNKYFVTLHH